MNPSNDEGAEGIQKFKAFLENNLERIGYDAAKRGGYPLDFGGIEAANKFICHIRIKCSGAWWYEGNANAMMRIRCAKFNGSLDRIIDQYKATTAKKRKSRRPRKSSSPTLV